jgi:plasmid maintenance system antidote protein VapI
MRTLTDALDRAGCSQRAFAHELGIPTSRVSEMVHGRRRLQPGEYRKAAEFLGLTDGELLSIVTEMPVAPKKRAKAA